MHNSWYQCHMAACAAHTTAYSTHLLKQQHKSQTDTGQDKHTQRGNPPETLNLWLTLPVCLCLVTEWSIDGFDLSATSVQTTAGWLCVRQRQLLRNWGIAFHCHQEANFPVCKLSVRVSCKPNARCGAVGWSSIHCHWKEEREAGTSGRVAMTHQPLTLQAQPAHKIR